MKVKPSKAERVADLFTKKAGDKLPRAMEIVNKLVGEGKQLHRAMADALEQLKLDK